MVQIERFLEMMIVEKGATLSTLSAYEADLKDFKRFLKSKALTSTTPKDLQAYLASLHALSASTVARRLSSLRQFYKFLMSEGEISENPTALIEGPRHRRKLPTVLNEGDVEKLLETAKNLKGPEGFRMSALLEILYASGLRVSELVSLSLSTVNDILKQDKPFLLISGKGNKDRLVPLTPMAVQAIQDYLRVRPAFLPRRKSSPWLFPSTGEKGHLTRQRFGQLLKELALKAGLNPTTLSPHVLRHAFATHLLQHGANLLVVQKLLGHSDISTTQIYTHVAQDDLANMVNEFHPLTKQKKN